LSRKEINLVVFRDRETADMGEEVCNSSSPTPELEIAARYALWLFGFQGAPPSSPQHPSTPIFPKLLQPLTLSLISQTLDPRQPTSQHE